MAARFRWLALNGRSRPWVNRWKMSYGTVFLLMKGFLEHDALIVLWMAPGGLSYARHSSIVRKNPGTITERSVSNDRV